METMNEKDDTLCKINNPEKRLKLKKDYKESIDNNAHLSDDSNNDYKKNIACTSQSPYVDDTISDFKSPKKLHCVQPKNNNIKVIDKSKRKVQYSKSKLNNMKTIERNKPSQHRKILHDVQQPLIESSFFKSDKKTSDKDFCQASNAKTAYVCPICFKNLKDESLQALHMKSCAIKNNMTTKKLLDAVELQERQAAERKSLGLLTAPILPDKKKTMLRKTSHEDPDLQLALALSKSLYEKEEMEKWDEVAIVTISSNPEITSDTNEQYLQKTTLQGFGFTSNKNTSSTDNPSINKIKRKGKPINPTILQKRTSVERERILTDRIAEVLIGYKDFTQRSKEEEERNSNTKKEFVIKNQFLQQLHQVENTLWDRTGLVSTQDTFYVAELSSHIIPLPYKNQKLNDDKDITQSSNQNINNENSLDKEQIKIDIDKADSNTQSISALNIVKPCCNEKRFLDVLATSWRNILNDSSASDVIVFVQNNRYVWAHKLVFYVRCTNILLDITSNDTKFATAKEKICWTDIDYNVALAFLEFIYCGVISKYSKILDCDASLRDIRSLARKYKVNDLFVYLRQKKSNTIEVKHDYNIYEKNKENDESFSNMEKFLKDPSLKNVISMNYMHDDLKNIQCSPQKSQNDMNNTFLSSRCDVSVKDSSISQDGETILIKSPQKINYNNSSKWETNTSPDIFNDTLDLKCNDKYVTQSKNHEDSNLHILLNLIKQDVDIDNCSQNQLNCDIKYLSNEDISISSKNIKQDIMEIDSNSINSPINSLHENSIVDTPQSKPKSIEDYLSNTGKQKSNLTLFIEKMQKENAKSDSDLDSDTDYSLNISPIRQKNPFHINKYSADTDSESHDDNITESVNIKRKRNRLSIIEECMQKNANKNPEFYTRFSNEHIEDVEQNNTLHTTFKSFEDTIESFHSNVNNIKNLISPTEKHVKISEENINTPLSSSLHSPDTKTMQQSPESISESIFDLETDENDISIYSKYIKTHKDNSIAKYREAMKKDMSDSNLSNASISSNSPHKRYHKKNDNKNNKSVTQSIFLYKDSEIIVSSDTEESMSSVDNSQFIVQNDNSDNEHISFSAQRYRQKIQDKNIENEGINQLNKIDKNSVTSLEQEQDISNTRITDQNKFSVDDREILSNDINFSMILTQTLHESSQDKINDYKEEFISSPIMVSSSPDFLNTEKPFADMEECNKLTLEMDNPKTQKKSTKFSFNYEHEIYLANVDIDKYDKSQYSLTKSRSVSALNIAQSKKSNINRISNKNNHIDHDTITNDIISDCMKLHDNDISLINNSENIKKFRKKSLSEGQIIINRSYNTKTAPTQFKPNNYNQNIGNTKTACKITDKDVTPPPNYNGMETPELHKKMKKYGLKVQKRNRAVKLLTHIYNELHPLIPAIETGQEITEISSDDEGPPSKKLRTTKNNLEQSNNIDNDTDDELSCSQDSNYNEMKNYESLSTLKNSTDITKAFTKLINIDKDLYNKILQYEPIEVRKIYSELRAYRFKCNLRDLMSFLNEQCIIFYDSEENNRNKARKKT